MERRRRDAGTMASTWTVASAQPTDARGDEQTPAPRYGHGAAIAEDIMTITHGYYFDHERCKPMFLDDTWEYHTTHKKWRYRSCLLYTSPSPRDGLLSRMPSSA